MADLPRSIQLYTEKYRSKPILTKERLKDYRNISDEYERLKDRQNKILAKIEIVNEAEDKERFNQNLKIINNNLPQYKNWLTNESLYIKTHFLKLKPLYNEILTDYYVNGKKWAIIIQEHFSMNPDYIFNYQKYKEKMMYWQKAALKVLLSLSIEENTELNKFKQLKKICKDIKDSELKNKILEVIG